VRTVLAASVLVVAVCAVLPAIAGAASAQPAPTWRVTFYRSDMVNATVEIHVAGTNYTLPAFGTIHIYLPTGVYTYTCWLPGNPEIGCRGSPFFVGSPNGTGVGTNPWLTPELLCPNDPGCFPPALGAFTATPPPSLDYVVLVVALAVFLTAFAAPFMVGPPKRGEPP
jgi:hypothetical protein